MRRRILWTAVIAVACFAGAVKADLWMPGIFTDNMVLQRDKPVPIWGWADPGVEITVTFAGQKKTAGVDKTGKWMVSLDPMAASADGRVLTASSDGKLKSEKQTFRNVVVGEVWLCSGQSNMDWQLAHCEDAPRAIARANYPLIRLFAVGWRASALPLRDIGGTWEICRPETVPTFSGVAFFFGERLYKEINVPIGLIKSAWGGTRIEPWTPPESFKRYDTLKDDASFIDQTMAGYREALKQYDMDRVRKWAEQVEAARAEDTEMPEFPELPPNEIYAGGHPSKPTALFNSMIAPLVPYAMRGVIWYQGESNNGDGMRYRDRMEALIDGWRARWGGEPFPFYYVQLAPFYWTYGHFGLQGLWEAQRAALAIPNTGIAGTADIAEPWTWHPRNKFDVGNRLALWALHHDYGKQDIVFTGPLFESMRIEGRKAIVTFDHADGGLKSLDGKPLTYLVIAGEDKEFHNADVEIAGNKLILSSPRTPKPVAVRYGWCQTAEPNLGNGAGLPALAFRTDDWEDIISTPRMGKWYRGAGEWTLENGVYSQSDGQAWAMLFTGLQDWRNYTFELEARRLGDSGSLFVYYRMNNKGYYRWNLGGLSAGQTQIQAMHGGKESAAAECDFSGDKWYTLKLTARDDTVELFVDGKRILTHTDDSDSAHKTGGVGVGGWRSTAQYRGMKLTDEAGNVLFEPVIR